MKLNQFVPACALVLSGLLVNSVFANSSPRVEVRDSVRGVSFSSIEISEEAVNALDVIDGTFGDSDSLVVGLSAMTFDGSQYVDEVILWVRHEGRRWLQFDIEDPVRFEVDGKALPLEQLRASQPFVGESSRMFEKVEYRLGEAEFAALVSGEEINITLRSDSGTVEKTLKLEEIERIRAFQTALTPERIEGDQRPLG